jgi:hypothetical protein
VSDDLFFPKRAGPTRKQKRAAKATDAKAFRDAVWERAAGRDSATGQTLKRHTGDFGEWGEVHHLKGRNVRPEWAFEPIHAVLLSAANHRLADARGGYRLKPTDPETGDPAVDASKPIRWTLYDKAGNVEWSRIR